MTNDQGAGGPTPLIVAYGREKALLKAKQQRFTTGCEGCRRFPSVLLCTEAASDPAGEEGAR